MDETAFALRQDLKQARADFRQTSEEIKRRLGANEFRFQHHVKRNPLRSVLISSALGFMVGRASRHVAVLLALLCGAAAGYSSALEEDKVRHDERSAGS